MIKARLSRLYAQTTPRGRGMIMLLAFVLLLALASGESVLYRLSYFLALVVVVGYAWTRFSLSRLNMRVERQSSVSQVGGVLSGSIYVRNDCPVPTGWLEILQISDMPDYVFGEVTRLPARGWAEWSTHGSCYSRGVYTVGPLMAIATDPLGLFRVQKSGGDRITVVVYPAAVELPYFNFPTLELSGDDGNLQRPQARASQSGTVREYSHGDSLNRIHWPSSARHGRLMSKEFDSGGSGDLWIVLDLEEAVQRSKGVERTDEYAVAAAASLARRALWEGRSLGLIAHGDEEYLVPLASDAKQMSRVMETLARSRTAGTDSLGDVLSRNSRRFGRLACLVIVTSSAETDWVSALEDLTYAGVSALAVIVDPMSFGGEQSSSEVLIKLSGVGIPAYIVRRGDALPAALSHRMISAYDLSVEEQRDIISVRSVSQV